MADANANRVSEKERVKEIIDRMELWDFHFAGTGKLLKRHLLSDDLLPRGLQGTFPFRQRCCGAA